MAVKEEVKFAPSSLMEGMVSIRAVISAYEAGTNDRKIERVLFDKSKAKSKARELSYIKEKAEKYGFSIEYVRSEDIDALTIGTSHGGIVAYASERNVPDIRELKIDERGFYVFLQGIEDPYNFGYSLRSLYAAGVSGVILEKRNWLSVAGVVCRASAGASERLTLATGEDADIVDVFRESGYTIVAADKDKNAVSVYDSVLRFPLLLVVGGEKRGITKELLSSCDKTVMLDYGREFRAALSAASASSVIAFEIFRQNREKKL